MGEWRGHGPFSSLYVSVARASYYSKMVGMTRTCHFPGSTIVSVTATEHQPTHTAPPSYPESVEKIPRSGVKYFMPFTAGYGSQNAVLTPDGPAGCCGVQKLAVLVSDQILDDD